MGFILKWKENIWSRNLCAMYIPIWGCIYGISLNYHSVQDLSTLLLLQSRFYINLWVYITLVWRGIYTLLHRHWEHFNVWLHFIIVHIWIDNILNWNVYIYELMIYLIDDIYFTNRKGVWIYSTIHCIYILWDTWSQCEQLLKSHYHIIT